MTKRGPLKHGHRASRGRSPTYRIWLGIKRRCSDRECKDYARYGGSGIRVCDRWSASFEAFLADMGERPRGMNLDRMNPFGDYEPGNCRWVLQRLQNTENKRNLRAVVIDGVPFPSLSAACRHFGLSKTVVHYRISTGVAVSDAIKISHRMPARRTRASYLPKTHPDRAP